MEKGVILEMLLQRKFRDTEIFYALLHCNLHAIFSLVHCSLATGWRDQRFDKVISANQHT